MVSSLYGRDFLVIVMRSKIAAPICLKKRSISEDQLIDGAEPAGGAALVSWLSDDPACVDF